MSIKRILWSLLAGVSLSLAGCDEDNPKPEDGTTDPVPDIPYESVQDMYGAPDYLDRDPMDMVEEDTGEEEEEPMQTDYGPPTP